MNPRLRKILAQVGSFALAGLLLFLALRGVDFAEVGQAFETANYWWLAPAGIVLILSHIMRAWRWQILVEALPAPEEAPPATLKLSFYSLMIGYMVNYAAPRLGEVARTANLSTRTQRSFSGVLGTVVVERILDIVVLALGLVSVFFLLIDQSETVQQLFVTPIQDRLGEVPLLAALALLAGVGVLLLLIFRRLVRRTDTALGHFWAHRLAPLVASFTDGLASVVRSPQRGALVLSTVLLWACYAVVAYLPFLMFRMAAPYGLTLIDGWIIMLLGALGVVVPSPGGIGSFHYITIQSLVYLYNIPQAEATTYAVLVHGAQMVLYIALGFTFLMLQGMGLGALRDATKTPPQQAAASAEPRTDPPPL